MFSGVAQWISDLYTESILHNSHAKIRQFWCIFSSAARTLGREHGVAARLVHLLIAIHDLPDLVEPLPGRIVPNLDGAVYWKDLPGFGLAFADYGICEIISPVIWKNIVVLTLVPL